MNCFSPFFTRVSGCNTPLPFPCGKCLACREQSAKVWRLRCELEYLCHQSAAFVTLTYSNEHLPDYNTLVPSHLSSFLKRLRKSLDYKIRYFACGEYGTKRGRPHYHLIIFGLKKEDFSKVRDNWHYADLSKYSRAVDVQEAGIDSLGYVAGYVGKKLPASYYYSDLREPPFHRCSLGLGLAGYFKMQGDNFSSLIYDSKQRACYIGRYLRNKVCERLGILEEVKALGIARLEDKLNTLLCTFGHRIDDALLCYSYRRSRYSIIDKFLALWKLAYEGDINKFIQLNIKFNRNNMRLDL